MICKKAGTFNFPRSLAIYLLLCLVAAQVTRNTSFCLNNRNLHTFVVSLDCNRIRIDTFQTTTKSNGKDKYLASRSLAHKTVLFARLVNVTLAANLIVLSNDVSPNPGPTRNLPAGTKGLRLFHLNIRSLRYNMDELRLFCNQHKPHVLAISETWLDDSFVDEEVSLQGYNLMRRDRDYVGGGVAVYVAEHLNYNRLKDPRDLSPNIDVESIWFELSPPKTKKILVGAIYKPPDSNASTFTESLEKILSNFTTNETILLGDFNFNYMAPNSATKNFKRLTNLYQLKQLITKPTRITEDSRTLIDLFLTSRLELYETSVFPVGYSDHCAIVGIRKLHRV